MVLDSVMQASMPHGYTVDNRSLRQMEQDSVFSTPHSLLIVTNEMISSIDVNKLFQLSRNGHTVMVASDDLAMCEDTLGITYKWNSLFRLFDIAGKLPEKGRLRWANQDSTQYARHNIEIAVYNQMISSSLEEYIPDSIEVEDSLEETGNGRHEAKTEIEKVVLMTYFAPDDDNNDIDYSGKPVAIDFKIENGHFIVVSAPLLFTNYMVVCGEGSTIVGRLMNQLKDYPVIRNESFMKATAQKEGTPFYVFLKRPPLRWALYLTLISIILFCIFTARRRQRVIPVMRNADNRNLDFVKLIGSLYWQQHDNAGLLAKKLAYTSEEIRNSGATLTEEAEATLNAIKEVSNGMYIVTDKELKNYINELNRILQSL